MLANPNLYHGGWPADPTPINPNRRPSAIGFAQRHQDPSVTRFQDGGDRGGDDSFATASATRSAMSRVCQKRTLPSLKPANNRRRGIVMTDLLAPARSCCTFDRAVHPAAPTPPRT